MKVDCIPTRCSGYTPESRILQSSVIWKDKIFVFGGSGGALGSKVSSHMYVCDLKNHPNGWQLVSIC